MREKDVCISLFKYGNIGATLKLWQSFDGV